MESNDDDKNERLEADGIIEFDGLRSME